MDNDSGAFGDKFSVILVQKWAIVSAMSSVDSKSLFIRSESDEDSVPSGAPSLSPSLSSIAESFSRRPGSNSHPQQPQFVTFDGKKTRGEYFFNVSG